ncbi:hypothetical protein AAHB45_09080 [Pediococcus pentosaceus]|uniref:hypothetical protein n=1 Tax=Pediococcus pentosaceus TaxID=1255 RepID=UPI003167AF43
MKDITTQTQEINSELSMDLNQNETEIRTYQQIGGQAIFEIGRRLKWVKDNNLAHGEFMNWYQNLGFDKHFVSRSIKIATNLSHSNFPTWGNLGMRTLSEIASLPEEDREKLHKLESGVEKKPEEMTVRELRELKKQLKKEREDHRNELKSQQTKFEKRIDKVKKEGIKEVEVPVEVIPEDYEELKANDKLNRAKIQQMQDELHESDLEIRSLMDQRNQYASSSEEFQKMTDEIGRLKHQRELLLTKNDMYREANSLIKAASHAVDEADKLATHLDYTIFDEDDEGVFQIDILAKKLLHLGQVLESGLSDEAVTFNA